MRIGIDGRIFLKHQSGIVRYATELTKNLLRIDLKNKYIVYVPSSHECGNKKRIDTIHSLIGLEKRYRIRTVNLNPILWRTMLFTKILDREVDVFHGMAYILPFVPRSMRKVKFISTFHGLQPVLVSELPLKEKLYWATNFFMSTMFADRIISVSGNLKKEINRKYGYPLENIDVTYAGIASSFFVDGKCADKKTGNVLKKYGVVAGKYIFYSGAGNLPQKNVSTVLEAAKILAHKYHFKPRFLISRTDLTEYKDYSINAKGIMWIEERDLPCLYACAAISIYASYCEGFGSPIIEARAAGSPVITSGISAMTEAAQGKAMLVKDPFSADEWAMQIYLLYKNKKMRARLARNGRAGLEEFSWESIARKTLRSYRKVYEE